MELKNKKIAFLGDSITEGYGISSLDHIYWNVLAQKTGAVCYGYGISGTRIAPNITPSQDPCCDFYFASRVEDMIPDAEIVVVFGGTNDYGHGDAPMGSVDSYDERTFCGAFHGLLQKLINRYPDAHLIVMTPLHRLHDTDCTCNEWGVRRQCGLRGYVDAITEIAACYGIPVLDLFRTSGLQPDIPILRERYMPDGLHPNEAGHQRIAQRLIGFLRML